MKKRGWAVLTVLVLLSGAAMSALAETPKGEPGPQHEGMGPSDMKGMRDRPCVLGMPPSQMVSTADGGVIVLIGKQLFQYDSKLNLVKTVDIPVEKPNGPCK